MPTHESFGYCCSLRLVVIARNRGIPRGAPSRTTPAGFRAAGSSAQLTSAEARGVLFEEGLASHLRDEPNVERPAWMLAMPFRSGSGSCPICGRDKPESPDQPPAVPGRSVL